MENRLEDFIKDFADQFEDTPPEMFVPDTDFKSLEEWDSLVALAIMSIVELNYDSKLSLDQIDRLSTIQELYDAVKSRE